MPLGGVGCRRNGGAKGRCRSRLVRSAIVVNWRRGAEREDYSLTGRQFDSQTSMKLLYWLVGGVVGQLPGAPGAPGTLLRNNGF